MGPAKAPGVMTVPALLLSLWWIGLLGLFFFLGTAAFKNKMVIGVRAYPLEEHRRRYEQWMLMPLLGLFTSMTTGISAGLIIIGGWAMIWGFMALSGAFFLTVLFGFWLGLVRRDRPTSDWGADVSLEAIHAEVTGVHTLDPLPASLRKAFTNRLLDMQHQLLHETPNKGVGYLAEGLSWRDCPKGGLGAIQTERGLRVHIPIARVLSFERRHKTLLLAAGLSIVSALALPFWINIRPITLVYIGGMVSVSMLTMFTAARARLVFYYRSRLEPELAHGLILDGGPGL